MRHAMTIVVLSTWVGLLLPAEARAEGFFIPWVGVNFGNEQAEGHRTFGISAGGMGGGVIGGEVDFGYSPDFFGESVDNHALTAMASLIVGVPIGGTRGAGLRPYVTGGLGLIRTSFGDSSKNQLGFDAGAGVMGFFSNHVGLRGDVRYFRNFKEFDLREFDIFGTFDFWRASIGIVLR